MSWTPFGIDRCGPELWRQGADQLVGWPSESTRDIAQHSLFPIYEEQDGSTINDSMFNYSLQSTSVPPLFDYTQAPVAFQTTGTGPSSEMANVMLTGCYQYDGRPIQNADQRPILDQSLMHTNVDQSGCMYQMPMPEVHNISPKRPNAQYCLLTLSSSSASLTIS
ncbi:uncharacterized protein BO88DRAFT_420360 [Aspergillus vadensis CBS 113365]|uniref:Uncharacterized protein n=1 Tax=Aspergillus vadensis (strain CBS 113365 / IMI 142717 / IBT 24658) TaxID=1448311 RepID=A0A319ASN8_ASPVC|nr:hypothetical protein BO88DRAFT_420360 [Aspergillus vadensis CBS 113365]PYH63347.1 hypothetical protein BO88DRAFT_420360 [Aspergillus vadensis CBS 113365]